MITGFHLSVLITLIVLTVIYRIRWSMNQRKMGLPHEQPAEPIPSQNSQPQERPSVTFLVPAWNARSDIRQFVDSYNSLHLRQKQLVLCAGGKDGSYGEAKSLEQDDIVVLEQPPGMGKQRALRESYPFATGELIFLVDIDCFLQNEVVNGMIDSLMESGSAAVTGPIRPLASQEMDPFVRAQWAIERYLAANSPKESSGLRGNSAIVRRDALDATGGFSQDAFSGTDYTLAKELLAKDYRIRYLPNIEMPSEFPAHFRVYCRKQARWTRNVHELAKRYGYPNERRATQITMAVPAVYVLLLIGGIFVSDVWLLLLALLLNTWLNRLSYCRQTGIRPSTRGITKHMIGDLAAGLLVVYQLITRRFTW